MNHPLLLCAAVFLFSCTSPTNSKPGTTDSSALQEPPTELDSNAAGYPPEGSKLNDTPADYQPPRRPGMDSIPANQYPSDKSGLSDTAMENHGGRKATRRAGESASKYSSAKDKLR